MQSVGHMHAKQLDTIMPTFCTNFKLNRNDVNEIFRHKAKILRLYLRTCVPWTFMRPTNFYASHEGLCVPKIVYASHESIDVPKIVYASQNKISAKQHLLNVLMKIKYFITCLLAQRTTSKLKKKNKIFILIWKKYLPSNVERFYCLHGISKHILK